MDASDPVLPLQRPAPSRRERLFPTLTAAQIPTGRRALARVRVTAPGEVIELTRKELLSLVQTDAELSEILMRAFILRSTDLIARGLGERTP